MLSAGMQEGDLLLGGWRDRAMLSCCGASAAEKGP
jgi:hypothetical protein